jgi:predicted DNA-binding protein YlxM (UPF0122 family)
MSASDFAAYRIEYEAEGIGRLLYDLILELVQQVVVYYPPEIYSPNSIWDEDAALSMCHDFTLEKLIGAGWLEYHLLAQDTVVGLKRVLKRDFIHFLVNRKRRSEYQNFFGRVKRILRNDHRFQVVYAHSNAAAEIWGLSEWDEKEIAQQLDEIVGAMYTVDLPPLIRYRPDSKKLSHLLSNDNLTHLLESTFRSLGKCIRLDLLAEGLRYRLGLLETDIVSLDEPISGQDGGEEQTYAEIVPSLSKPELEMISAQIAEDVFERLTNRQRSVLALRFSLLNPTLEQIGDQLDVSKSSIHNDLTATAQLIAATGVTQEEAEKVLLQISELCTRHLDHNDENTNLSRYN